MAPSPERWIQEARPTRAIFDAPTDLEPSDPRMPSGTTRDDAQNSFAVGGETGERISLPRSATEACRVTTTTLSENPRDVPVSLRHARDRSRS
jgi:hypothetical protein